MYCCASLARGHVSAFGMCCVLLVCPDRGVLQGPVYMARSSAPVYCIREIRRNNAWTGKIMPERIFGGEIVTNALCFGRHEVLILRGQNSLWRIARCIAKPGTHCEQERILQAKASGHSALSIRCCMFSNIDAVEVRLTCEHCCAKARWNSHVPHPVIVDPENGGS